MGKKIDKSKTIIKDDGREVILKNGIVYDVIYTKPVRPLTHFQRKKLKKREQKHIDAFCKSWFESECDY